MSKERKPKTFKEYYSNEEFRRHHLENLTQKVTCDVCNKSVSKCNLYAHKRSKIHMSNMRIKELEDNSLDEMKTLLEAMHNLERKISEKV